MTTTGFKPNMAYGAYRQADLESMTNSELRAVERAAARRFNDLLREALAARVARKKMRADRLESMADYFELLCGAAFDILCDRKKEAKK